MQIQPETKKLARMAKFGIGLVPEMAEDREAFRETMNWSDTLKYKTQIADARNSQLEYQQNVSELHSKIRQACKELTRKDNNIKENMETLALERGRLGYLRDELARRAEELARREIALRGKDLVDNSKEQNRVEAVAREKDMENAFILEMDLRRRSSKQATVGEIRPPASGPNVVTQISPTILSVVPPSDGIRRNFPIEQFQEVNIPTQPEVAISAPVPIRLAPITIEAPNRTPQQEPMYSPYDSASIPLPAEDIRECLDGLWREYSSTIDEDHGVGVMSLPNFLRLCTDADFGISTAHQIEIFLDALREGSFSLVQRSGFMDLLKGCKGEKNESTNSLFTTFLFPLFKRLQMQERRISSKHPPLPASCVIR